MEQTDKTTTKSPLFKKTRAQLIEMIEELKNVDNTSLKEAYKKLQDEKDSLCSKISELQDKNVKLTNSNQTLSAKLQEALTCSLEDANKIDKYLTSRNLWKFWALLFCMTTVMLAVSNFING